MASLFETDYPHPTCLIGEEIDEAIRAGMQDVSDGVREKTLRGYAERLYSMS